MLKYKYSTKVYTELPVYSKNPPPHRYINETFDQALCHVTVMYSINQSDQHQLQSSYALSRMHKCVINGIIVVGGET